MNILTIFEDGRIGGPLNNFFYFLKLYQKKSKQTFFDYAWSKKRIKFRKN